MCKSQWWRKWWGVPIALVVGLCGFLAHPLWCLRDFLHYRRYEGGICRLDRWDTIVRACTDIEM